MTYKSPRVGHRSEVSGPVKTQKGSRSNQSASNAAKNATFASSDHYPSSTQSNPTNRVRPAVKDSIQRGYVAAGDKSGSTRKVGNTIKKVKG